MHTEKTGHRALRCPVCIMKGVVLLVLVAFAAVSFIPVFVLEIRAEKTGKTVFARLVSPGDAVCVGYTHSVEFCPVRDYFTIDEELRFVLRETTFSSCNTGLPVSLAEGETFHVEEGCFRIAHMNRVEPALSLWVDEKYGNTLEIEGDRPIELPALAGNALLSIAVKKMPLAAYARLRAGIYVFAKGIERYGY